MAPSPAFLAHRGAWRLVPVALCLLAAACGSRADFEIEVLPSADGSAPVFVIGGRYAPQMIIVERTDGTAPREQWHLDMIRGAEVTPPVRVEYGTAPAGYRTEGPATVLGPGEYVVRAVSIERRAQRRFRWPVPP
jgi:hypothetical protein